MPPLPRCSGSARPALRPCPSLGVPATLYKHWSRRWAQLHVILCTPEQPSLRTGRRCDCLPHRLLHSTNTRRTCRAPPRVAAGERTMMGCTTHHRRQERQAARRPSLTWTLPSSIGWPQRWRRLMWSLPGNRWRSCGTSSDTRTRSYTGRW